MATKMPPIHPAADKFPMMSDAALRELAADIKQNGQRVPIQMLNGAILDGRNRWKACEIAKVAPVTQDWKGEGSPAGYVLSINLHRRHLTPEQHAAVAVEFEDLFREEAEARMKAGKPDPSTETRLGSGKQDNSNRALAQAAQAAGASLDSAQKLKAAAKVDREILDLAKQGQVNVTEAKRLSEMSDDARKEAKAKIKSGAKARDVVPKPEPKKPAAKAPTTVKRDGDEGPADDVPEVKIEPPAKPFAPVLFGGKSDDGRPVPGDAIPEVLRESWDLLRGRFDEIADLLKKARSLWEGAEVEIERLSAKRGKPIITPRSLASLQISLGKARGDVTLAISRLKTHAPAKVCDACKGDGCATCWQQGWMGSDDVRSAEIVEGRQ